MWAWASRLTDREGVESLHRGEQCQHGEGGRQPSSPSGWAGLTARRHETVSEEDKHI